jgi:hypothetical protein
MMRANDFKLILAEDDLVGISFVGPLISLIVFAFLMG